LTFTILLAAILIFVVDGLPLIKKKQRKELTVFVILLGFALFAQIMSDLGFPTLLSLIDKSIGSLGRAIFQYR
jgi:hypothetical protein